MTNKMKIYTSNDFVGYYPVPVAAVVVAESPERAKYLLLAELYASGLDQDDDFEIIELETTEECVLMLSNGDY